MKTATFDPAEHLSTPESRAGIAGRCGGDGRRALYRGRSGRGGARAGHDHVAREAGVTREALYRALSEDGDPRLSTLLGVAKALGLTLSFNMSSRA